MQETFNERLDAAIHSTGHLVAVYFDPEGPFAGHLFDELGSNPSDQITSDDLVATSLLDVQFGPQAVRALLVDHRLSPLLSAIPPEVFCGRRIRRP